jgi:hypothetical protein
MLENMRPLAVIGTSLASLWRPESTVFGTRKKKKGEEYE